MPNACTQTGRCSSDDFICAPTNGGKRPSGIDVHGCVPKNCAEGFACPSSWTCDPLADDALETGCVPPVMPPGGSGGVAGGSGGASGGVLGRGAAGGVTGSAGRNASGASSGGAVATGGSDAGPPGTCVDVE